MNNYLVTHTHTSYAHTNSLTRTKSHKCAYTTSYTRALRAVRAEHPHTHPHTSAHSPNVAHTHAHTHTISHTRAHTRTYTYLPP